MRMAARLLSRMMPLAVGLVFVIAPPSEAGIFDFAAVGNGGPVSWDAVTDTGERGYGSFSMTVGSLTVTATASLIPPDPPPPPLGVPGASGALATPLPATSFPAFVYLDAPIPGPPPLVSGMGVCLALSTVSGVADQCAFGDELSPGELLMLSFSSAVTLDGVLFRNPDHETSLFGHFGLSIDGSPLVPHDLSHDFAPASTLQGTDFVFAVKHSSSSYYIQSLSVSSVPEPAGLGILGVALLALGWRARRRA